MNERPSQRQRPGIGIYLQLVTTAVLWGSAFVGSKMTVASVAPSVAAFLRFGIGSVVMLIALAVKGRGALPGIPMRKQWIGVAFLGIVGVGLYNLLFFTALRYTDASHGSMIIPTLTPILTLIIASIVRKTAPHRVQVIGLCTAFAGAAVFFASVFLASKFGSVEQGAHGKAIGDALLVFAAVCWATYTFYGGELLKSIDPFQLAAYAMAIGAFTLGVLAFPEMASIRWRELSAGFWWITFYLALLPSVVANWFYYRGVRAAGAPRASTFMYLVPVSGVLLSVIILGESLSFVQVIGAVLMILGVVLVNRVP